MKSLISFPVAGLLLLNTRPALCEPPSVEAIMADIFPRMVADHSTFWVAFEENRQAAERFAIHNNHMTIRQTDPENKWRGDDATIRNWSRAYARLSSGTGFVFYDNTNPVPDGLDVNWEAERAELEENDDIFEVIQVSRTNVADFKQIIPADLAGEDLSRCTWTNCGVEQCPNPGEETAHSMYSNDIDIIFRCHGAATNANARTLCCPNPTSISN